MVIYVQRLSNQYDSIKFDITNPIFDGENTSKNSTFQLND